MAPETSTQTDDSIAVAYTAPAPAVTSNLQNAPPSQNIPLQQQQQQQQYFQPYNGYILDPRAYGQPVQAYGALPPNSTLPPQQQQQQQMQYQHPPMPEPNKAWELAKLGLHGAIILLSIIGLAVALSLLNGQTFESYWIVVSASPVYGACIIWSAAELITRCARRFKSGIHPGAHVALCLILWLATSIAAGMESTFVAVQGYEDSMYEDNTGTCWDSNSQQYVDCSSDSHKDKTNYTSLRSRLLVVSVFTALVFLAEFALFIGACVDTAKRNAAARRPIMVVSGPPYWGPVARGFQPMQDPANVETQQIPLQTRDAPQGEGEGETGGESKEAVQTTPGITEFYTPRS